MRRLLVLALAGLVVLIAGCATSGDGPPPRDAELITRAELESLADYSVYDAVQRLRPAWLRSRSPGAPPLVMVDGVRMGGPEVLHGYWARQFTEIRHRGGPDATTLYGTGVAGGTIELRSRAR